MKNIFTFIFIFFSAFCYGQIGQLYGRDYMGTKVMWNNNHITYRLEIKVGNSQTGRVSTCYKDISFINPDSKRDYTKDYFLLWETTRNLILPFYELYILDGGKWKIYSEIPQKL